MADRVDLGGTGDGVGPRSTGSSTDFGTEQSVDKSGFPQTRLTYGARAHNQDSTHSQQALYTH